MALSSDLTTGIGCTQGKRTRDRFQRSHIDTITAADGRGVLPATEMKDLNKKKRLFAPYVRAQQAISVINVALLDRFQSLE
jgi:hypothetical protein